MSGAERKYSEQEVAQIIQEAVEGEPGTSLEGLDGMSLAEVKAIGAEVGIDPQRIENAAHALVRRPDAPANPLLGAPTAVDYEARVPGEIPRELTPEVVALIRRATGKPGKLSELHGTVEWRADGDLGSRWVTVSSHGGHTTIRASARLGQGAAISFIPAVVATIASVVPVLNAPSADGNIMALVLIPIIASLYLLTRGLWSRHAKKEAMGLQRAVEEISRLAESVVAEDDLDSPTGDEDL